MFQGLCATILISLALSGGNDGHPQQDAFSMFKNSELTLITDFAGEDREPSVSPDGTKVAFLRDLENDRVLSLWIYDLATGTEAQIGDSTAIFQSQPTWTPDGHAIIASMRQDDGIFRLVRIDTASGSVSKPLFPEVIPASNQLMPSVHPTNSNEISFSVFRPERAAKEDEPNLDIVVADISTGQYYFAAETGYRELWGRYTSDGTGIIFFSRFDTEGAQDEIYRYDQNTRQTSRLTDHPGNDFVPTPSPDGKWIAYASNEKGNPIMRLIPIDGGDFIELTTTEYRVAHPSWFPDSRAISFTIRRPRQSGDIAILRFKGKYP